MASQFKNYVNTIVCSIAVFNNNNKFEGFLSSNKYEKDYKIRDDGTLKFNTKKNNQLKEIASNELKDKIKNIDKKYKTIGPIMFR